jgi:hypothetical protein
LGSVTDANLVTKKISLSLPYRHHLRCLSGGDDGDSCRLYISDLFRGQDSAGGVKTGYLLDGPCSIPGNGRFSLLHSVQTDSGAHPASYPMGTGGSFVREVKRKGREADHSPAPSVEMKKGGAPLHSPIFLHGLVIT